MFTTIEPRLIALLNNERPTPAYIHPSLDLPPLHDPNILKSSGRPPPLEPDAVKRMGKLRHQLDVDGNLPKLNEAANGEDIEGGARTVQHPTKSALGSGRALGLSSPQSLRKILDVVDESTPNAPKKRPNPESAKDEFVQLPQPVKKHKAKQQVVPPIIIGLFEPPPQAALFPPISSSSFHDSHGQYTLNTTPVQVAKVQETSKDERVEHRENAENLEPQPVKRKDVRPRKKWTEAETNNLLLGVHKHGVGNWMDILTDPDFTFNKRSGADLKDRFRTCCPAEWRAGKSTSSIDPKQKSTKSSLEAENILISDSTSEATNLYNSSKGTRKSKAHRKKLEDLAQLGIDGPFRKSHRRERRPFTEQEDQWILEGYNIYGAAWAKIQKEPRFQLQNRQPTDLRDRFRNKHPEKFRADADRSKEREGKDKEKDPEIRPFVQSNSSFESTASRPTSSAREQRTLQGLAPQPSQNLDNVTRLQQSSAPTAPSRDNLSIQQILSVSQSPPKSSTQYNLRDVLTFTESSTLDHDTLPFTQSFDWTNPIIAPLDEMGISRLLLDEDTWPDLPGKERQTFTNINSIISTNEESSGFYNLLDEERENWGYA